VGHHLFFNTEINVILELCIYMVRIIAELFLFTSVGQKMILQTVYIYICIPVFLTLIRTVHV